MNHTNRLRVESCIVTIMDVHNMFETEYGDGTFLSQFKELRTNLEKLDMGLVSEGDILLVEKATNALLREFRALYERCDLGPVYQGLKN